jgi:hypothetical protein
MEGQEGNVAENDGLETSPVVPSRTRQTFNRGDAANPSQTSGTRQQQRDIHVASVAYSHRTCGDPPSSVWKRNLQSNGRVTEWYT